MGNVGEWVGMVGNDGEWVEMVENGWISVRNGGQWWGTDSTFITITITTTLNTTTPPCIEMRGMKDNFTFFIIICFFLNIITILMENMDNTLISDIILTEVCGK